MNGRERGDAPVVQRMRIEQESNLMVVYECAYVCVALSLSRHFYEMVVVAVAAAAAQSQVYTTNVARAMART